MKSMKRMLFVIVISGLVLGSLALLGINFYTDWLWFSNIGYLSVFKTIFFTKLWIKLGIILFFAVFVFVNLLITKKEILEHKKRDEDVAYIDDEMVEQRNSLLKLVNNKNLTWIFLGISILVSLLFGSISSDVWRIVKEFLNSTPFNITDPIFANDIGFYIFELPFYKFIYQLLTILLVVSGILSAIIYLFINSKQLFTKNITQGSRAKYHLSVLVALFMLLKAWGYLLSRYDLLYSTRGVAFGASYTDVNASLFALNVLAVLAALVAVFMIINIFTKNLKLVFGGVIVLLVTSILLGSVYPQIIQQFNVEPNELTKEKAYIKHNIRMTKKAYNLDEIEERPYSAERKLTYQEIENNPGTINNIRLWDNRPLKQTYSQLQEMRLYYNFANIDIDRYKINGEYRQVMLGARELNQDQLPSQANTWINRKLKYTHGFGLAMNLVNRVSPEGLPEFLIENIPPETNSSLKIKEPRIYFGEQTNEYVVANNKEEEFDYPKGDQNAYNTYQRSGGVQLDSIIKRLAFASRFSSAKMILNGDITGESRLLFYRNIQKRVNKIAPFLSYDSDPYMVIGDDGKLYWIQDAYTTTDMYPYSEPYNNSFNYIRNSVKVVIDAHTGEVNFYIIDESDPLIKTYSKVFPKLFKPFTEMPEDLKNHIRYPKDLFKIQTKLYRTYHMNDPTVFYNKEDLWTLPTEKLAGNNVEMQPYYTIMQLPDQKEEEFILMLPFTPNRKNNMISWLAARSDEEDYGKLRLYKFPKQRLIYGPMQIESRIDQNSTISRQLSLWDQKGSRVIRGNLLVIPIGDSILYVEPIYLQSNQSELPEMKRIVVSNGNKVVMARNLDLAFAKLFEGEAEAPTPPEEELDQEIVGVKNLTERALELYKEAQTNLQKGNWNEYGKAIDELKSVLEDLRNETE
ncbi:UPF0182 family protein [Sporohalobacter salinus]|uniref:UPF0182 family membrane protein n=1 Tax=Sporohalobacter salinus TaxID=1494606 RepID=UPI0019618C7B|nr:UPF0182 family protein [Sporohalobacter salinus]MBM7624496.1 uncharacterized membrane protein (UPF0182 family) [Sporohalobacter salinus]